MAQASTVKTDEPEGNLCLRARPNSGEKIAPSTAESVSILEPCIQRYHIRLERMQTRKI